MGTLFRETILSLLPALRARGWRCVVGLKACGFGWRFQRQHREVSAEAVTFATEALTGRRKTNTRDAAALAGWSATPPSKATPGPSALSANPRRRNSSAAF